MSAYDVKTAPRRRVLIVGASGELGGALALCHAKSLDRLVLWGRDTTRLQATAARCRDAGAEVVVGQVDLLEIDTALAALLSADAAAPIDLAYFAAGLGDIRAPGDAIESADQVARLAIVNFTAPAALAAALAGRMAARRGGGIVIVGSAAAFHDLPFAAGYAGSKAGLARFAAALSLDAAQHGVAVTLVSPGFIDTAAGRRVPGPKPFALSPAAAAAAICRAARKRRRHAIIPWPFAVLRWLDRLLPTPLRDRLLLALAPATRPAPPARRDAGPPG